MIPWNVSRSRAPVQLSNPVGEGALNLKHDVALVQALLRSARRPGGDFYYRGPIDGNFGPGTLVTLQGFRADHANPPGLAPRRPLAPTDPAFHALARVNPNLAVLHGTTTVYSTDWSQPPPQINQNQEPVKLSGPMLSGLQTALADLQRTTGMRFDVKVEPAGFGPYTTQATLFPQGLKILTPDGQRRDILRPEELQRQAPELAKAVRAAFDHLMTQRVGLSAAARAKNASRPDLLSFTLRTEADRIETEARDKVIEWRRRGWSTAARFLEFYLDGRGRGDPNLPDIVFSQFEALSFAPIREAHAANIRLFAERTLKDRAKTLETLAESDSVKFEDHWQQLFRYAYIDVDADIKFQIKPLVFGIQVDARVNFKLFHLLTADPNFVRFAGETTFESKGKFTIVRNAETLSIEVAVTHLWADFYDFHVIFGVESKFLERELGARPFAWEARWKEDYVGTITGNLQWVERLRRTVRPAHL